MKSTTKFSGKRIGFYGDSFCSEISNLHSLTHGYDTYIKKIQKHYDAEIVSLGVNGSSYWDVIINQFDKDNLPDVCIFIWTEPNRVYHPTIRSISYGATQSQKIKHGIPGTNYYNTWKTAGKYYEYLHNFEKAKLENLSALYYFDREVLSKLNTKIIHLWSFEAVYEWQNGINISTPMCSAIPEKDQSFKFDLSPNHIAGDEKNTLVANWLIGAIDE